ncbi:TIGR03084 family metal-binding protein [Saccharopolyspora phatthalungensis]|uniref:Uncharacterized protein (TIGR03084 family) n=1 Tax=Saccharopolyspora phatthalungensis TaxID=664693 RepID=A0A840QBC9_9PSEU|nr:TIGR03084 family metal-binding protein [Saccharopolyspora phatthalungensis]MBB5159852.1 uncharacterized protein (TIGR03084 family) [Saccharopolyspora phatthalungensis]
MPTLEEILTDLRIEGDELDRMVRHLDPAAWATLTPAEGWTIAHQVSHLASTDDWAITAVTDPAEFGSRLQAASNGLVEAEAAEGAREHPHLLLARWRRGRHRLLHAASVADLDARLPWFGPPMKLASMVTARIMETWAHGQDVADALHVDREPTARLRHIAHLGIRTMAFAFTINDLPAPDTPVRVELLAPNGDEWVWGPEDASNRVRAPALDFCLLVTRRRHPTDVAIAASGEIAQQWMTIAQAYAGPPGPGRSPAKA